jgi:hypothetical protein
MLCNNFILHLLTIALLKHHIYN